MSMKTLRKVLGDFALLILGDLERLRKQPPTVAASKEDLIRHGLSQLALHIPEGDVCAECGHPWPCETFLQSSLVRDEEE